MYGNLKFTLFIIKKFNIFIFVIETKINKICIFLIQRYFINILACTLCICVRLYFTYSPMHAIFWFKYYDAQFSTPYTIFENNCVFFCVWNGPVRVLSNTFGCSIQNIILFRNICAINNLDIR